MDIIAHCIEGISQLLTEDFKQIENETLDFSTFIKDVQQTMCDLSVDIVENVMEKRRILFIIVHNERKIIVFSDRMMKKLFQRRVLCGLRRIQRIRYYI